jgi:hypothetical protein
VGRYATLFFGILDDQGNLEFINAGHPSPILIRGGASTEAFCPRRRWATERSSSTSLRTRSPPTCRSPRTSSTG